MRILIGTQRHSHLMASFFYYFSWSLNPTIISWSAEVLEKVTFTLALSNLNGVFALKYIRSSICLAP